MKKMRVFPFFHKSCGCKLMIMTALLAGMTTVSCSEDNPDPTPDTDPAISAMGPGAYILNQGHYASGIEGELSFIDLKDRKVENDVFTTSNHRSLGDTPQCGVAYGSKIYIGVYGSHTIEILDASTRVSLKQIKLDAYEAKEPRAMAFDGGKVYISMFDGFVARLDTTTLFIDKMVKVGPNPETPAVFDGKLFVPNSDGMNWMNGYGTTASVIDLASFTVTSTINVPLNPEKFITCNGNLFLLCKGDYGDVEAALYKIDRNIETIQTTKANEGYTYIANATMVASDNNQLYLMDIPFNKSEKVYSIYDPTTGYTREWTPSGVVYPNQIGADPKTGNIIITSYIMDGAYPSYTAPGFALLYDHNLVLSKKFDIGAGPATIFFQ